MLVFIFLTNDFLLSVKEQELFISTIYINNYQNIYSYFVIWDFRDQNESNFGPFYLERLLKSIIEQQYALFDFFSNGPF